MTTLVAPTSAWRPYADLSPLTASMTRGPEHVSREEMAALAAFLETLIEVRGIPVHVNVAFNAVYFGYDVVERGYVGGPLDLDAFPLLTHGDSCPALPVGSMVRLATGSDPLFGEVIYREGAHDLIDADGTVPGWLSGAPAGAHEPRSGDVPTDTAAHPVARRERVIVDFAAFTAGLTPTPAQLDRLRHRGRYLDNTGHVIVDAEYNTGAVADLTGAEQYQRYLRTHGLAQLCSAAAPVPLPTLLADGAGDDDLEAALAGIFATLAAALACLRSVRLWGSYAFSRAQFAYRLNDAGPLGKEDLGTLADQLARAAVPSHTSRWGPDHKVAYTAITPLLRQVAGGARHLLGVNHATTVIHAHTVVGDWARSDADPDTGLHANGVHLRVDDTWQGGGIWRAERPGVVPENVDVTDPLGLGWVEAAGLPSPLDPAPPEPDAEPEPIDDGRVLNVSDSQVMWIQTLREAHQVSSYLPIPSKLGALFDGMVEPGRVKLAVHHDGYQLDPDEASQEVNLVRDGEFWSLTEVSWPLEFFPGIILTGTWQRGGRMLRVTSTLLDAPVTVDGADIEHRYDPAVLTKETRSGTDPDSWIARIMTIVRQAGQLDVQGEAVIDEIHLLRLACNRPGDDREDAEAAIADLLRCGKLTRLTASVDASGDIVLSSLPGVRPITVLRYVPTVVVGRPRPPVPAVLRGLMATSGVEARMVRDIEVVGHLRHLPAGRQARAEKRAEYREFRARYRLAGPSELPDGYTFVSPFQRGI
ncbi:hypothetical protein EV137_0151 [Kribbella pratensis]|uniref:Uncharacterized protein n=1 Tax=Kribbella pratensis TaxID=2512112 RepID=A0ABY2FID8_9ACTN|nr:hypothetical protein [Kribbella pratensis]TDW92884.1 hypothetical protein EV137_0151 [Kribbella pratensis]